MANNLATTELSTIFLTANDPLNQDPMNRRFQLLLANDIVINELFANSVGIWECSWYADSSIKGYSIGDAVWLNTEDPDKFVELRAGAIKRYTDLNSQILNKLPNFDSKDETIVDLYKAAMSGYTDANLGRDVVLPPIFDIGDISKPIQLLVSLKNNNKALLTDETAWRKIFVDTEEDEALIRKIIKNKEAKIIEQHLIDYHLSGKEDEVQARLSDYLDLPKETIDIVDSPKEWQLKYDEQKELPSYGLDYVRYAIRKPYVLSGAVSQYQGVRYWNSGLVEHFGTIATNNSMFIEEDVSGVQKLKVPFNWKIANDESGAKAYAKGELGGGLESILSAFETPTNMVPPKDNLINVVYEKENVEIDGMKTVVPFKNGDYNVSVNAVFQNQAGEIDNNYPTITYGEEDLSQNWNANYLTNEVLDRKAKDGFTMRLDTRVLPPYISYYAVGQGDF